MLTATQINRHQLIGVLKTAAIWAAVIVALALYIAWAATWPYTEG